MEESIDFRKVCRTCLSDIDLEPLFFEKDSSHQIAFMIMGCAAVTVNLNILF